MPDFPTVTAHTLNADGHGLATLPKRGEVAVPGLAPGSKARVQIRPSKAKKGRALGHVVELVEPSSEQVQPPCHHAAPLRGACGGCPLMHLVEETAHQWRVSQIQAAWGGRACPPPVLHATQSDLHYRNRTHLLAFLSGSGQLRLGSRAPHAGGVAWMRGCMVTHPALQDTVDALERLLQEHEILTADASPDGLERISARVNRRGEVLLELITRTHAPWIDFLSRDLLALPNVRVLLAGQKHQVDNRVWSDESRPLTPTSTLDEELDGRLYRLDSRTFFQLNVPVAESMAQTLATWVSEVPVQGRRSALDLYCGVGILGHGLLQRGLVERLKGLDAVSCSTDEATRAGSTWASTSRWEAADLEEPPADLLDHVDLVLVNPPRRGLSAALRDLLTAWNGSHLFYMSCDLHSLCQDLDTLAGAGWAPARSEAWVMLPQTKHTEFLVELKRN